MAHLSWTEVRERAIAFSRAWVDEHSEAGSKQSFWNEFFSIFGRERRTVASFEVAVRNLRGDYSFIDLLWRGVLLVEHKSRGRSLAAAESQAFAYIEDLAREGRFDEIPRYVIVSDFARIALYDLEPDEQQNLPLFSGRPYAVVNFPLTELHRYVRHFAFIKGEKTVRLDPEDPANERAYRRMCELHDELAEAGFFGSDLERLLVRILFCLFADDTGVFEPETFETFLRLHTREDGEDVGARLNELFDVLNTPEERWPATWKSTFAGFRYVNGELFKDHLGFPPFTRRMRNALLNACEFQWARVSPAVFGSLFQGILDDKERRQEGAHYTSERDILKVVRPLFLDPLQSELEAIAADSRAGHRAIRLTEFQRRLRALRLLDPACGCGNFLVLAYRELRRLELEALKLIHADNPQRVLDIRQLVEVDVDQFYGIERSEWPARIAEVAMWLMDHQMNQLVSESFGQTYERLPLRASPHIVRENALRVAWEEFLPAGDAVVVLGNPPFVGKHLLSAEQQADMQLVWGDVEGSGSLDYVSAWYRKAAQYAHGTRARVAFVSTNSITQGEQPGILWADLFQRWGIKIHFAHRTFSWRSEARGAAHVHVVVIGFGAFDVEEKLVFDYEGGEDHASISRVKNISPYLVQGPDLALPTRAVPICEVPPIVNGNKPADGGHLILGAGEVDEFLRVNPGARPYVRPFLGAEEYLQGKLRAVLWLVDAPPQMIASNPGVLERVQAVKEYRLGSKKEATRRRAERPALFDQIRQPRATYIVIPRHSSEKRRYIPFGYFDPSVIIGDSCTAIADAEPYHFGVVSSQMHMAWVRTVGGRIKSDIRYSNKIVYNNFPWPLGPVPKAVDAVTEAVGEVLEARAKFLPPAGLSTLADLYDPLLMPAQLVRAHSRLDRAVDRCYRREPFRSDLERVEFLFQRYEQLTTQAVSVSSRSRRSARLERVMPDASQEAAAEANASDEGEDDEAGDRDEQPGKCDTSLPGWYLKALDGRETPAGRGEVVHEPLDELFEEFDARLATGRYAEYNNVLQLIASEPERSSLAALIGVLTVTLHAKDRLPYRETVLAVARKRLLAAGHNVEAVLRGL